MHLQRDPSSDDRQNEVIAHVCSRSFCSVLKGTWVCKNRDALSGPYLRQRRSLTEPKPLNHVSSYTDLVKCGSDLISLINS